MILSNRTMISLSAVVACGLISASRLRADNFDVDPVHSSVVFRVQHNNLNHIFGSFSDIQGSFTVDGQGGLDLSVGVESIDTRNEGRDRHLKSPDFFSARQFPRVEFQSKQVKRIDDSTLEVTGELKLRGTAKPVTAKVRTATGSGRRGEIRGGMETTVRIKRSDFNLGPSGGLGDEVTIMVSLQGVSR